MKNLHTMLLSAAATFAASLGAQEATPQAPPKPQVETKAPAKKDVGSLIKALGSDSYRERLDAERALKQAGTQALPALEEAAAKSDDVEVQWRARRLLRQIGQADGGNLVQRDRGAKGEETQEPGQQVRPFVFGRRGTGDAGAVRDQFESLFEQFERDFGIDIPRARFFHDDFFRDLQEQMGKAGARSQGMTMQIGPDGAVKVEVQEKGEDGKVETKTYEAPDMETFQKNHPGVLRQNGLGMGLGMGGLLPGGGWRALGPTRGFTFDWNGGTPRFQPMPGPDAGTDQPEPDDVTIEAPAPAPVGKRLGISVAPEIPAAVREYLQLAEGVGLMVQQVAPGSLAEALGLQPGDIVTKVGEQSITSPQDVQKALAPVKKGEAVEVQFVRKGNDKTAKAAKTEDVEPAAETSEQPKGKLERRRGSTIR